MDSTLLGRLSTRFWQHICGEFYSFWQKSISALRHWCQARRPGLHSVRPKGVQQGSYQVSVQDTRVTPIQPSKIRPGINRSLGWSDHKWTGEMHSRSHLASWVRLQWPLAYTISAGDHKWTNCGLPLKDGIGKCSHTFDYVVHLHWSNSVYVEKSSAELLDNYIYWYPFSALHLLISCLFFPPPSLLAFRRKDGFWFDCKPQCVSYVTFSYSLGCEVDYLSIDEKSYFS